MAAWDSYEFNCFLEIFFNHQNVLQQSWIKFILFNILNTLGEFGLIVWNLAVYERIGCVNLLKIISLKIQVQFKQTGDSI